MKFGTFLLALVEPMLAKILVVLGLSMVSIVGVEAIITQLKDSMVAGMSSMSPDMLAFVLYLWIGKAMGLIFGAMTAKLALWSIEKSVSFLGKNPS